MIGIIGAMSTEVDSLIQKINNPKLQKIGSFSFVSGTIYDKEVVILKSGIGKVASAVGVSLLIQNYKPSFIINTGIAGGVSPLKSEDIYATTFLTGEGKYTLAAGLNALQATEMTGSWPVFSAAAITVSLPVLIIFFVCQKYMVSGLTAGGVKG